MADYPGKNGFAYIDYFSSLASANWTEADEVSVEVAAAGALDGLSVIVLPDQQGLHFAQLQGVEDAAQSGDAAGLVAGLVEGFANRFLAAPFLRFGEDPFCLSANLLAADVSHFSRKSAQQLLRDIGMQLRFELRGRMSFLAAQDPLLKHAFVQQLL